MAVALVTARLLTMGAFASDNAAFTDWTAPTNFGSTINSAFNDQHPAITPDGLSLYFVSDRPGGSGGFDLWVAERVSTDSPWETPQNLGAIVNSAATEFAPNFSSDGHYLFFGSDRPGGCGSRDLWVSHRKHKKDNFGWETPVNLGCVINAGTFDDGPTYFEDPATGKVTLFFTSLNRPDGQGDFDIYSSDLNADGSFSPPANVAELNSPYRDTRTAIRKDGLEMFFASNRPGGLGVIDLWVATRASTTEPWGVPVNLGPVVNSSFNDGAPAISRDGRSLYFYSDRPGGSGLNDLYFSTRTPLD
jgi:Tol biopolymer transport system component